MQSCKVPLRRETKSRIYGTHFAEKLMATGSTGEQCTRNIHRLVCLEKSKSRGHHSPRQSDLLTYGPWRGQRTIVVQTTRALRSILKVMQLTVVIGHQIKGESSMNLNPGLRCDHL